MTAEIDIRVTPRIKIGASGGDTDMAEESTENRNISVSVPMGAIATAILLGLAAAAYTLVSRNGEDEEPSGGQKSKSGNMRRKLGLMTLATLIENDASRKLLVSLIRAMARRS